MMLGDMGALHIGIAMGAASMLSIGPNNLMLLKSGLCGRSPGKVVMTILGSYVLLVALALVLSRSPAAVDGDVGIVLRWGGLVALLHFSLQAFRSGFAVRGAAGSQGNDVPSISRVLKTVWFNPLTYLELLLIPMSLAQTMSTDLDRITFGTALLFMSTLCCLAYAFGGVLIARMLKVRRLLACFDLLSATILAGMSVSLAANLFEISL